MRELTVEDFVKYECTDSRAIDVIFDLLDQLEAKEQELKRYDRDLKITQEQIYFASILIRNIECVIKSETCARDIKDKITVMLEQTLFKT